MCYLHLKLLFGRKQIETGFERYLCAVNMAKTILAKLYTIEISSVPCSISSMTQHYLTKIWAKSHVKLQDRGNKKKSQNFTFYIRNHQIL